MTLYDELVARGLIAQVTNEEEIKKMINEGKATFYIGFDPTADSLHVGHFMALCLMKRLQMAGNKPIALLGGDDQWANMLGGTELIRKKLGKDAHAMTITLLLNSEGKKMGKTEKGAVWLDPEKTSPFEFFQYWRNVGDADVMKCIRMLTFLPIEEIEAMSGWEGSQLNKAKEILAYELTKLVHGEEEANKALDAAKALFGGKGNTENMPTTELELPEGKIGILDLMVATKLVNSKREARTLIAGKGVAVNDVIVEDPNAEITIDGEVIIRKGKKVYHKVVRK